MKKLTFLLVGLLAATTLFLTSCDGTEPEPEPETNSAYDFISNSADHASLKAAIDAAGLVETLSAAGTFTVFAPTDAAFQAFLDANNFDALGDVPTDVLTSVLLNHVLGSVARSTDLSNGYVSTLAATTFGTDITHSLYVNIDNGVVLNGTVNVTAPDNDVDNGTIHVVDAVINLPNIVTFATSNPALSSLVAALTDSRHTTDFVDVLSGAGPFTVFAPTNDAFQALLDSNPNWNSLADVPIATLDAVLKYHVTSAGNVRSSDLQDGANVPTLQGDNVTIDLSGSNPMVVGGNSSASIVMSLVDIQGSNGVVHVIDTVLLP